MLSDRAAASGATCYFTASSVTFSLIEIGFVHRERIGLDEQFVVLLPEGRDALAVLCQVAYYQPLNDHACAVGARLVRILRQPAAHDTLALPEQAAEGLRSVAS